MTMDTENSAASWGMFIFGHVLTLVLIIWFVGAVMPSGLGGRLSRYIHSGR